MKLASTLLAAAVAAASFTGVATAQAAQAALPVCPVIVSHGGYPTGANPWDRDQLRAPNNFKAVDTLIGQGSGGFEADVQLTKVAVGSDGTVSGKAVMWHNTSTHGLDGVKKNITDIYWSSGSDKLQGRTLQWGPYKGEGIYSLRQWLDHVAAKGAYAELEIKSETKVFLVNGSAAVKAKAWSEITDPVRERYQSQAITVYSHDPDIAAALKSRVAAGTFPAVLGGGPSWPDTVKWEEPPPSWSGNSASWQANLATAPKRVATSWTPDYKKWLAGRCS
ncbi:hypothetical protein [Amycolatopsis nalaikhensis]|uniref:Secreted protein n=1 Tax=Amycolatopsis nalaikhensis TaxID=715472 RepID=A0ABY8XB98_9PSEU|nr:hypothetical protein [Amycolatopsis sp. 2-2]WIV53276.1 hypothetical protein QP939_30725 [Amycolatopsis sp. 2-2]